MSDAGPQSDPASLVSFPAVVLSDLHLAHPATFFTDPKSVTPLAEGARTVVFNGDAAELLHLRQRVEGMEKLLAIGEHCRAAGAAPVHLTGNHDPEISPIHSLDLCGGSVFVTHGDSLHPHVAPWSHDAPALKAEYDRLCALEGVPETWEDVCRVSKRVALVAANSDKRGRRGWLARGVMVGKFALEPWRAVNAVRYWAGVAGLSQGIQARHRPKARLMVIGHTHRPGIWKLPGFTLVNTGSYQPLSKPRAVRLTETEAQVFEVVRDGTVFRFGRELLRMSLVASENGSAAAH